MFAFRPNVPEQIVFYLALFPFSSSHVVSRISRGCSPSRGARVKASEGWLRLLRARETVRLTSDVPRLRFHVSRESADVNYRASMLPGLAIGV